MIKSWRMCVATRVLHVCVSVCVEGVCRPNKSTVRQQMPVKFWQVSVVTLENFPSSSHLPLFTHTLPLSLYIFLPLQRRN